ncbi:uncharacterized protein LOC134723187 [Mytilus trossulus]|uniref:uncharacterized protein LOC134723187 n=1 Tax=Mytilus trossulus TaxID=6551 RepID=UPI003003C796
MSATTANIPMPYQFIPHVVGIQQDLPVGQQQQVFPVRTFKVFGGIQIGLGVLLGILSLIGVISDKIAKNKYDDCLANTYSDRYISYYYNDCYRYHNVGLRLPFDITCFICSGWHVLTGCLPMCMSKKREKRWTCLKTGFMVCSIIGASIFIPAMLSLGVYFPFIIAIGNQDSKAVVLSVFMAVLSFAEVVIAIIASSFCCCCSTWRTSIQETQIPMANSHQFMIASGQTDNQIVQYSRGQQYQVIPTTQPTEQVQVIGSIQPEQNGGQVVDTNPPAYTE